MTNKQSLTSLRGQSMFEVVIALFIVTLIIVGVVVMSTNSISNSIFSRNKTQAGRYSQEAIEWLRSERILNANNFVLYSQTPKYCLDSLVWTKSRACLTDEIITGTIFKREALFTTSVISDKNIIEVIIITFWTDSKGYHEARSVTNFNDTREK